LHVDVPFKRNEERLEGIAAAGNYRGGGREKSLGVQSSGACDGSSDVSGRDGCGIGAAALGRDSDGVRCRAVRPLRQSSTTASSSNTVGSSASGMGAAKARRIASNVKGIPEQK